jgi:TonB-linked SusC/RagA family outer membrane protein
MEMGQEAFENAGTPNNYFTNAYKETQKDDFDLSEGRIIPGNFSDTKTLWLGHNDWTRSVWETAFMHSHNISVSGKSENNQYYFSVGMLDQNSMLKIADNSNEKYFVRIKDNYSVIDGLLKIGTNMAFERQEVLRPTYYDDVAGYTASAWTSMPMTNPEGNPYNYGGFVPPTAPAASGDETRLYNRTKLQFSAELTPMENLSIKGDYAINTDFYDRKWVRKVAWMYQWDNTKSFEWQKKNGAGSDYAKDLIQVANLYADYKFSFLNNNFDIVAGMSHEEIDNRSFGASRDYIVAEYLGMLDLGDKESQDTYEGKDQYAIDSYFGRFSYDYAKKYFLEVNYRRDGTSKFHKDERWGNFYGVAGAWVLTQEEFMKNIPFLDFAKLRMSYGELGNQNADARFGHIAQITMLRGSLPFGNPTAQMKQQYVREGYYDEDGNFTRVLSDITRTWETVKINNFGLDLTVLDSKLSLTADYFVKNTVDILVGVERPSVLGIEPPKLNSGEFETKGFEFTIKWNDKIGDLNYFASFMLSDAKTEVTSLEDSKTIKDGYNQFVEGHPVGSYFGLEYAGIIKDQKVLEEYKKLTNVPGDLGIGDIMYLDKDGDGIIEPDKPYKEGDENSGDLVYLGNNATRYNYSINLGASWKGLDFSVMFQGVGEWNVTNNSSPMGGDWWNQPYDFEHGKSYHAEKRPDADWPRLTSNGTVDGWNWRTSTGVHKMFDNNYIRLKNLQVGYTLPKSWLEKVKVNKLRLYFTGTDLWSSHGLPEGFDPEKPFNYGYTPFPSIYSFGIQLTL